MLSLAAWLTALGVVGFAVTFLLASAAGPVLRVMEWHHAYLGVVVWAVGAFVGCWPLALLGSLVLLDDAFQHAWQFADGDLSFRSPLHRLWLRAAERWPRLAQLSKKLDDLLGGGKDAT